jgi:hypothetical protein
VVLFGGDSFQGLRLSDTWEWNGENWTQVDDIGPSARAETAMAYDATRQKVVLFGGTGGAGVLDDTWEWNGEDWTQSADSGPAGRTGHTMVFDSHRNRVLLFGGDANETLLNDTWEWDGSEWVQLEDIGPGPRSGHAMAFDMGRNRAVLFGGFSGRHALGDTWEWDGTTWTQMSTFGPPACFAASLIHNGRRALLFGGVSDLTESAELFGNTWEWDGRHWTIRQDLGPGPRWAHAMAFDAVRSRGFLFGGTASPPNAASPQAIGDTWEQFERGTGQEPSTGGEEEASASFVLESLTVNPVAGLREGQPAFLHGTWNRVLPDNGGTLILEIEREGVLVFSDSVSGKLLESGIRLVLAGGRYTAKAELQQVSFVVDTIAAPTLLTLAPLTIVSSVESFTYGDTFRLRAILNSPAPAGGLLVPLRYTTPEGKPKIWPPIPRVVDELELSLHYSLTVAEGQSQGEIFVRFSEEVLMSNDTSSGIYVWTASLGGVTDQEALEVTTH